MSPRAPTLAPRDQSASPFSSILLGLCENAGASCAAFVDSEGETVDYAGRRDPYHAKIVAAELRLVMRFAHDSEKEPLRSTQQFWLRATRASFLVCQLEEGYAVVLEFPRRRFSTSKRAVVQALRELSQEAGLPLPERLKSQGYWRRVEVQVAEGRPRWRPAALWHEARWRDVVVLGRYLPTDLGRREVAYRVRLETGVEFALVREPLGSWYAEDLR